MLESKLQSTIIKTLEEKGYYLIKVIRANKNGIPDLIVLKGGKTLFIEAKAEKGVLSKLQAFRIEELARHGFETLIVNSLSQIEKL